MQQTLGNNVVPHENDRIKKELEINDMNIKLLQKQVQEKELVRNLTKLNLEINKELGAEYVEMCRFALFNLKNDNINTTKEDVKCPSPLKSAQCEDININIPNLSLHLPVSESTNNLKIELPN